MLLVDIQARQARRASRARRDRRARAGGTGGSGARPLPPPPRAAGAYSRPRCARLWEKCDLQVPIVLKLRFHTDRQALRSTGRGCEGVRVGGHTPSSHELGTCTRARLLHAAVWKHPRLGDSAQGGRRVWREGARPSGPEYGPSFARPPLVPDGRCETPATEHVWALPVRRAGSPRSWRSGWGTGRRIRCGMLLGFRCCPTRSRHRWTSSIRRPRTR